MVIISFVIYWIEGFLRKHFILLVFSKISDCVFLLSRISMREVKRGSSSVMYMQCVRLSKDEVLHYVNWRAGNGYYTSHSSDPGVFD